MVEYATGVNLWREWATMELANIRGEVYPIPESANKYAGILICLARQQYPDLSAYDDPEVVWRLHKKNHAGLIIASENQNRIEELIDVYSRRFSADFLAFAPPLDEAPS